jgi:hypothetical protein
VLTCFLVYNSILAFVAGQPIGATCFLHATDFGVSRYVHDSAVKDQEAVAVDSVDIVVAVEKTVVVTGESCYQHLYSLASPIERGDSPQTFREYSA